MRFEFDLSSMELGTFIRSFFEIPVPAAMLGDLRLTEGQALRACTPAEALSLHPDDAVRSVRAVVARQSFESTERVNTGVP
jgi:hypothetical protein